MTMYAAGDGGMATRARGGYARPAGREERKRIAGFFIPNMWLAMHMMVPRLAKSLQTLMTEAINDVLKECDESPLGD